MKALKTWGVFLTIALILSSAPAAAQTRPDPIALDVPNIEQETKYWCWAALVQQIVIARKIGQPPSQCQLVNAVNEKRGRTDADCCLASSSGDSNCDRMADAPEIGELIRSYGTKVEQVKIPARPEEVYDYLISGRVLLCGLKTAGGYHHIYLVRGLSWENGRAMLLVNDPASGGGSLKIDFDEARATWMQTLLIG